MPKDAGPLETILQEIERALQAQLYYAAVNLALSVPDICSALEKPPGHERYRKIQRRYEAWCEEYLIPHYGNFTAQDCWVLRGGVVHNAMLVKGRENATYDRILFTLPARSGSMFHDNVIGTLEGRAEVIQLDLSRFCQDMIDAARHWYGETHEDDIVAASLPDIVRLRPEGVPYFISGVPVIA